MHCLFGLETEYAFSAFDREGNVVDRDAALRQLLQLAVTTLPHLPDAHAPGLYLANGSRFYVDYGSHPEWSSPELDDPAELVRYTLAGEKILADLTARLPQHHSVARASLFRCNVDYSGSGQTWGCHESYLCRTEIERVATQILPHLVSRVVYTGAGGFDNLSGGLDFMLSPRVVHLRRVRSGNSTEARGILHGKDESLCRGSFHRLHLICGESLCSERANYLKVGTTALLVRLADAGREPESPLRLVSPLSAMRAFSSDVSCQAAVRGSNGRLVRALDVQRACLEHAEAHLGEDLLPDWAEDVCREWRAVLERLEEGPEAVETLLDWGMKLALYRQRVLRSGIDWEELPTLSRRARLQTVPRRRRRGVAAAGPDSPVEVLAGDPSQLALDFSVPAVGVPELDSFRALRSELLEIDTRFGELGERGIFVSLDRAGVLSHGLPGRGSVEEAVSTPPARGRAHLRGSWIARLSAERKEHLCDWQTIFDPSSNRVLDLGDPFGQSARWRGSSPREPALASRRDGRLQDRLRDLIGSARPRR